VYKLHNADIAGVGGGIIAHTAHDFTANFTHKIRREKPRRHLSAEQFVPDIGPAPNFVGIAGKGRFQKLDVEMLPCF
jgi:hypothetical protein